MNSNGLWKNVNSDEMICTAMMLQQILTQTRGIIVIEGPSGCGKTSCLKNLKNVSARQVFLFSYRDITDEMIRTKCNCQYFLRELSRYNSIICIEDIDYLSGKDATQALLSQMVQTAAERHLVILTGSNMLIKTPMLYGMYNSNMFVYALYLASK